MRRAPGPEAAAILDREIPAAARDFAAAVMLQLARPLGGEPLSPAEERAIAGDLVALLRPVSPDPRRAALAARLASHPALLSAVFQNMDLLYERGFPGADAVSLLVMDAIAAAEPF